MGKTIVTIECEQPMEHNIDDLINVLYGISDGQVDGEVTFAEDDGIKPE